MRKYAPTFLAVCVTALTACTAHPRGETSERRAAEIAGVPYSQPAEKRELTPLPPNATPQQLATYALLANGDVERAYWDWRAAIEQIPQDGTQKTDVSISITNMITNGQTAWDMTTLAIGNDPMANIVLPGKLSTSAAVALEDARAAGLRFDKARADLREKVLAACADYALTAEQIRLENDNLKLLAIIEKATEARLATNSATQQDLLRAANETALATNTLASLNAKMPSQRAALNDLLNRAPQTPLTPPAALPAGRSIPVDDEQLLDEAAKHNPELRAQWHDIAARKLAITRAQQDFIPDVSVNASTDLAGITQSLLGSVTVPLMRYQAIDASVNQARARFAAAQATHRQAATDLAAQVIQELAALRDNQRQIDFYEKSLLPRAKQIVATIERSYSSGTTTILDMLEAQRSLIAIHRMVAELKADEFKSQARLSALLGLVN